jgi:hypothetical protein
LAASSIDELMKVREGARKDGECLSLGMSGVAWGTVQNMQRKNVNMDQENKRAEKGGKIRERIMTMK